MITSADHFNKAMGLWFDITGFDPDATRFTLGTWELRSMNEELKATMGYDPSFITTYLLLDAFSTSYFKQAKVSIHEFDQDPEAILEYMTKVRDFKALIRSPEVEQVADAFFDRVRQALSHYGIAQDRVEAFLAERSNLAIIRRDALLSFSRLRVDQFLRGEAEPEGYVPVYNKDVYGYWNINSLIKHACSMPSGIAVNLIRDPDELHSYFTISIRNGGNLLTMTDVPEYAHPLGRMMSRRPDRDFASRAVKNWFPYQLLNIKYDDKGDPYHDKYRESLEKGLVPHQPDFFCLMKIADLDIAQITWITLMFDLIRDAYWNKPIEPRALSYTNEMIRITERNNLLESAAGALIPVDGYQPIQLEKLAWTDVLTDALDERAVGEPYGDIGERFGRNRWMEERYGPLIPQAVLNQIGAPSNQTLFLTGNDKPLKARWRADEMVPKVIEDEIKAVPTPAYSHSGPFSDFDLRDTTVYRLDQVDATMFGTEEQLDADRKFIARKNFAVAIQREADREFEREIDNVMKWFYTAVKANQDKLLSYVRYDKVEHVRERTETFGGRVKEDAASPHLNRYYFMNCYDLTRKCDKYESKQNYDTIFHFDGGRNRKPYYNLCLVTGAKASFALTFTPGTIADIALMTNTPVEEIPEFLHQWNPGDDPYIGNPILNRIDPLEWHLDNPWNQVSFSIDFFLSKTGRKQLIKRLPKPEIPDVSNVYYSTITQQNGRRGRSQAEYSAWGMEKRIKDQLNDWND